MGLCGTGKDHCCWLGPAGKCQHVTVSDDPRFKWACSLRQKHGSWDAVHASQEYLDNVKPYLEKIIGDVDCGNWPPPGQKCSDCGEVGNG